MASQLKQGTSKLLIPAVTINYTSVLLRRFIDLSIELRYVTRMDLFSQSDYYPAPSSHVITYSKQHSPRNDTTKSKSTVSARKTVLKADIPALIVHLSSPMAEDGADYTAFADFFLMYRYFITPQDLHDLLILRFRWCIREITAKNKSLAERRIAQVALVRTFVLLRHSLLNYFVQDMLHDIGLRLRIVEFLNSRKLLVYPKIISDCMITLKKIWVNCLKLTWDNLDLNEPKRSDTDSWMSYELKDITQLNSMQRRNSRFSSYTRQSITDPDFRNKGTLSFYNETENFQLPNQDIMYESKNVLVKRSPSIFLFPENTSNATSTVRTIKKKRNTNTISHKENIETQNDINYPKPSTLRADDRSTSEDSSGNKNVFEPTRNISHLSALTHMSGLIKELDCPKSYSVDKLLPSTPSKKIEFILNSAYVPNELQQNVNPTSSNNDIDSKNNNTVHKSPSSFFHRGVLGLLAKWKKNHNRNRSRTDVSTRLSTLNEQQRQNHQSFQNGKIDTFVKYVISISSLQSKLSPQDKDEMLDSISSKFDILSARTIDEVEYLIALENKLLDRINRDSTMETPLEKRTASSHSSQFHGNNDIFSNINGSKRNTTIINPDMGYYSTMDNLDLYHTVSSIAHSVISLSHTWHAQQRGKLSKSQNLFLSPSQLAVERSKRKTSFLLRTNTINSTKSIPTVNKIGSEKYDIDINDVNDEDLLAKKLDLGPQRLVFSEEEAKLSEYSSSIDSNSQHYYSARQSKTQHPKSINSSPLKSTLFRLQDTPPILEQDASFSSTISYDSESSLPFPSICKLLKSPAMNAPMVDLPSEGQPALKKKSAITDLREFTFEDSDLEQENDNSTQNIKDGAENEILLSTPISTATINVSTKNKQNDSSPVEASSGKISITHTASASGTPDKDMVILGSPRIEKCIMKEELPLLQEEEKSDAQENNTCSSVTNPEIPSNKLYIPLTPTSEESLSHKPKRNSDISDHRSIPSTDSNGLEFKTPKGVSLHKNRRNRAGLSSQPVIRSIDSIDTLSTVSLWSTNSSEQSSTQREGIRKHEKIDLRAQFQKDMKQKSANDTKHSLSNSLQHFEFLDSDSVTDRISTFPNDTPNNNASSSKHSDKNKYIFTPDDEGLDFSSPEKNVDVLKSKYLNKETYGIEVVGTSNLDDVIENEKTENNTPHSEKVKHVDVKAALNQNNLSKIANIPDDSVNDNPIMITMMKLEGTYKRSEDEKDMKNSEKEDKGSTKSLDWDSLSITSLPSLMKSPIQRQRSLFIERRRQSALKLANTPRRESSRSERKSPRKIRRSNTSRSSRGNGGISTSMNARVNTPLKIQELMRNYEISDSNLLISNANNHIPFILMYDSLSIAQQMTLIERELLREIDWKDLLDMKVSQSRYEVTSWLQLLLRNESLTNVDLAISRFNITVDWIISEILLTKNRKMKRNVIQRFIHVAEHCLKLQNYNTLMEIILALSSSEIQSCRSAWLLIEPGDLLTWEELKQIPSLDRNYANTRTLLNSIDPSKGCIPFIVVYLLDLSLNAEKNDWIVEDQVVNYGKFDTMVQIVKNFIQRVQWSKFYEFEAQRELLSKCVYISALTRDEITQLAREESME